MAEIFDDGLTRNLIVSGGTGKEGFDEATVMAKYLSEKNIPEESIIIDPGGMTTEATAQNAAKIMQQKNWHSVIIVSQYFQGVFRLLRLSFSIALISWNKNSRC